MNGTRAAPARRSTAPGARTGTPSGGDSPSREVPADLRLVPPALAAWAAAALALGVSGTVASLGVAACAGSAGLLLARGRAGRTRGTARSTCAPFLATTAALTLLSAAAGGAVAALHAADLRRGPLPRLADEHARVTLELTVTGDPRRMRPRVHGAQQAPAALLFEAEATRVTARGPVGRATPSGRADSGGGVAREGGATGEGGPLTRTVRTPVLVIVRERDGQGTAKWLRLLPSTGLRLDAALLPPSRTGHGQDIAAVVRAHADGPPPVFRKASTAQRTAGSLRAGLREATEDLGGDARGLLPGLVVGDTSRLPPGLEAAFRTTDMTHLLAVSGANLTIMLAVLIGPPGTAHLAERRGLAPRLGISLRGTAALGALLTLAFVVVCRPEPSVIRAAACGLITLLALVTGRRRSLLPALAAAVLLLVLIDPWLALDFGFLLSVLATGALLTLAPRWSAALRHRGCNGRLAEALAAAGAAQTVCAPVVAVLAAHVSLVAVPCNLLAEFAVAPATVLGFAALAAAPFAMPLAKVAAWGASWPTEGIAALARTGADLPGAEISWPGDWGGALLLAVLLVAVVLLGTRFEPARRPWLCAACVLVLLIALTRPVPLVRPFTGWPPSDWRAVACDVGQGDALALAAGQDGTAVVVDAGPDPDAVDDCLRALDVSAVPLLVLTHFHADHVAGLPGVLKGREVGAIQTTSYEEPPGQAEFVHRTARESGVPVIGATAGERRRAGDLTWRALWPLPRTGPTGAQPEGANDASITLLFRARGMRLLLPGDLEPDAQRRLLTAYPRLPPVDVLKVAHHGSAYQYPPLLAQVRPRIALISAGADNPYGHPAPRTLTALRSAGALVRRTDRNGALAVTDTRIRGSAPQGDGAPAVVVQREERREEPRGQPPPAPPLPDG
ncbi:ComEC/Rec2 family competence protein [Streptomyces ovatisporus]|uniref:ComEC/Rec2 family competence protein n=1 Tax=Streptomyces ovatisporus TaxID=1128682 RepID=A0ABV9A3E2_9ACTN